jgi:hypothetical protein
LKSWRSVSYSAPKGSSIVCRRSPVDMAFNPTLSRAMMATVSARWLEISAALPSASVWAAWASRRLASDAANSRLSTAAIQIIGTA